MAADGHVHGLRGHRRREDARDRYCKCFLVHVCVPFWITCFVPPGPRQPSAVRARRRCATPLSGSGRHVSTALGHMQHVVRKKLRCCKKDTNSGARRRSGFPSLHRHELPEEGLDVIEPPVHLLEPLVHAVESPAGGALNRPLARAPRPTVAGSRAGAGREPEPRRPAPAGPQEPPGIGNDDRGRSAGEHRPWPDHLTPSSSSQLTTA